MKSSSRQPDPPPSALGEKLLLVILGSYRSKRHIYERARKLGVRLVVIDGPGHWVRSCAGPDDLIEKHLAVDLWPFATFVDRSLAAVRKSGLRLGGIGTIDEFAGGFSARIAEGLSLPFHSVAAADLARDKHRVRERCAEDGLKGPRVFRIQGPDDLRPAAAHVGFPAVLKPVSGVGSVQAFRVGDLSELVRRHEGILAEVSRVGARCAAPLSSDRDWFGLMWSGQPHLTMESWIEGQKYDVDLLLDEGRVVYGHVTDDLQALGIRDVRRVAPSGLDRAAEAELVDHAAACVRAIGFRRGAFNVEVKRTPAGPRMIEVNGRLGGYSTTDIHEQVWGVDLVEQWLRASLGLPLEVMERSPRKFVAESLLPAPRSGVVVADGFLDELKVASGVVTARPWVFRGDVVAGIETGSPDWLGALLCEGQTREEALDILDALVARLSFPVR